MQACGGLIKQVDIPLLIQILCKLYPLPFTTGEGGKRLSECQIGETCIDHCLKLLMDFFAVTEEFCRFFRCHV